MSKIIRGANFAHQPVCIQVNLSYQTSVTPVDEPLPEPEQQDSELVADAPTTEEPPVDIDLTAYISQAETEAQRIIAEAQNNAQEIQAQAEAQAQQIITDAEQAAGKIKDDAASEGQALGFQQGKEQGYQEAAALLEQAAQIVDHARREREEIIDKCEKDVLELAIAVAARVVHTEVTINSEIVLAVVKDAIQKAKDQEHVLIRVNPADFETVAAEKQSLQAILQRETGMEIRGDIGVEIGGCVIDTDYGAIDARIDTQLGSIKSALLGVVKRG